MSARGWLGTAAALLLVLLACTAWLVVVGMQALTPLVEPPALDAAQLAAARRPLDAEGPPVALLLASNAGTEITDLLGPFEVLAESGAFAPRIVAVERSPVRLTGGVAVLPDFTLDEAPPAALIIVPAVIDPSDPRLVQWLRERAAGTGTLLSICEGARLAGQAGWLDGRRATTHFFAVQSLRDMHPQAQVLHDHRYVVDGALVSSAGVSAGIDATLFAVERLAGRDVALATAARLGHAWIEESDPEGRQDREPRLAIGAADAAFLARALLPDSVAREVRVVIEPGASELAVAAWLDVLPRSLRVRSRAHIESGPLVRTRHGLTLAATPALDGPILRPGSVPGAALDAAIAWLEEQEGERTARLVATMIEQPYRAGRALSASSR